MTDSPTLEPAARTLPAPPDGSTSWLVDMYVHTHWDREWYLPFERYRLKLVGAVDRVLDVLAADPDFGCYVLDGQTIVLDDYLELRPERGAELADAIRSGRIEVGPWYILPDEFLVSGESIVRNLLEGRRGAARFGEAPPVGYLPDPFGHVAQLPAILDGFGIRTAVFSRGMGDEYEQLGSEFEWAGCDGESSVVAIVQAHAYDYGHSGYCNASFVGSARAWDLPELADQADRLVERLASTARTNVLLFAAGEDHATVNPELPRFVRAMAERWEGVDVRLVGLREVARDILESAERAAAAGRPLARHAGELRGSRDAPILASIFSARIPLKQDNVRLQTALERVLEPLAGLAGLTGCWTAPLGALRYAWRLALQNQPHDSIGGCSVDATHDDMPNRTKRALEVCDGMLQELRMALGCDDVPVVFNPSGERAGAIVAGSDGVRRYVRAVPGLQLAALDAVATGEAGTVVDERTIESEAVRVRASADGRVELTLRGAGADGADVVLEDALRFVDVPDAGDEYDFGIVPGTLPLEAELVSAKARPGAGGVPELHLLHAFDMPRSLTPDRAARSTDTVRCELATVVRVAGNLPWAECETSWTNEATDHRLRLAMSLGAPADVSYGDGHFAFVERPAVSPQPAGEWRQQPVPIRYCEAGAAIPASDGSRGAAVLTRGLHEYELAWAEDGTAVLELTLLRAVGWLSRDDVPGRPGHAGPALETPGGQCLGPARVEYALTAFSGHPADAGIPARARRFATGMPVLDAVDPELTLHMAYKARAMDIVEPLGGQPLGLAGFNGHGITVEGGELSAVKPADDGSGDVVLRVFNPGRSSVVTRISVPAGLLVHGARIDETLAEPVEPTGGAVELDLPAGAIRTLRLARG